VVVEQLIEDTRIRLAPLLEQHAADICTWRYPSPYDCYDMTSAEPDVLLRPELGFHAVLLDDRLIGFRSYGPDGQVPGWEYDDAALDTGGGLRPECVGQGLGRPVTMAGLAYGRVEFAPSAFRVTVAAFNVRALRVVESLGFSGIAEFAGVDGRSFRVLVRSER
jgi:ribosomal-protein-alanine N-acetyltransferase